MEAFIFMKEFFKIGEISKLYHIGPDSLRYYEELGILTPKRTENNYRIYSIHDLWRLNVIRDLRSLDFSMERIKEYLDHRSISSTEHLLKEELNIINDKIKTLEELRDNVETRLHTIREAVKQPIGVIEQKYLDTRFCHVIHSGYKTDEEMDMLIKKLLNKDENNLYIIGNNKIGSVLSLNSIILGQFRKYESVFIVDKHGKETIAPDEYTLDSTVYTTTVKSGETSILSTNGTAFINAKIPILKVDKDGNALAGAKLVLRDDSDKVIDAWTTTTDAHVVSGLVTGKSYTLHETEAPNGYKTAEDITFTATAYNKGNVVTIGGNPASSVTMTDEDESLIILPETGGMGNTLFILIGTCLIGAAAIIHYRKKPM